MVDFLFLDRPVADDEAWAKAVAGDPEAVTILTRGPSGLPGASPDRWTRDRLHGRHPGRGRGVGRKLGKARRRSGWPSPGRRVGLRCFESLGG